MECTYYNYCSQHIYDYHQMCCIDEFSWYKLFSPLNRIEWKIRMMRWNERKGSRGRAAVCVRERDEKRDEFNHWIQAILPTPCKDLANDNNNSSRSKKNCHRHHNEVNGRRNLKNNTQELIFFFFFFISLFVSCTALNTITSNIRIQFLFWFLCASVCVWLHIIVGRRQRCRIQI